MIHCVIVRAGLPLGVMAAQIIHAAGESAAGLPDSNTRALAVEARSDGEMYETLDRIRERGLAHVEIHEPDAPYKGALLAIGIRPVAKGCLKFLQHLPLIKSRSGSSEKEQQVPNLQVAGSSPAPSSNA